MACLLGSDFKVCISDILANHRVYIRSTTKHTREVRIINYAVKAKRSTYLDLDASATEMFECHYVCLHTDGLGELLMDLSKALTRKVSNC